MNQSVSGGAVYVGSFILMISEHGLTISDRSSYNRFHLLIFSVLGIRRFLTS